MIGLMLVIIAFLFQMALAPSQEIPTIGFAELKLDKGKFSSGENLVWQYTVINYDSIPYSDLIVKYRLSGSLNLILNEEKISLDSREVRDISGSANVPEVPSGKYQFVLELYSPGNYPITFISKEIELLGTEKFLDFSKEGLLLVIPRIVGDKEGSSKFETISSGAEGENILPGESFKIRFILDRFDEEIHNLDAVLELQNLYRPVRRTFNYELEPLDSKSKLYEIELSLEEPGTYEGKLKILEGPDVLAQRNVRIVIIGESASILEIKNFRDIYRKGENVKISFLIVGPADGSTIVKNAELYLIVSQKGKNVYKDKIKIDEIPFNPKLYEFEFQAPEDLLNYEVKGILKKNGKKLSEISAFYKDFVPKKVLTDDGRIRILEPGYCFDDGVCDEEELKLGDCFDCKNYEVKEERKVEEKKVNYLPYILIFIFGIILIALLIAKRSKEVALLFIFMLLFPLIVQIQEANADPTYTWWQFTRPPSPRIITSVNYQAVDEIKGCGEYTGEEQTIVYCPDPLIRTIIRSRGGTVLSTSIDNVCGRNNRSWATISVSKDWYCPMCKALAIRHKPGYLDSGFASLSSNRLIFRSNDSVKFYFNAYIPACVNRIPMMNLDIGLVNGSNITEYSKIGVYARHKTIDYGLNELGGVLENFVIPDQEEFRKIYDLRATLKSYRMWSWRQRFAEALKRVVLYKNLKLPREIDIDELPPGEPFDFGELYLSRDFMSGGFSVNASATGDVLGTNYTLQINATCNLDVSSLGIDEIKTAEDLKSFILNENKKELVLSALEENESICSTLGGELLDVYYVREIPGAKMANFTDEIIINVSKLDIDGIENSSELVSFLSSPENLETFANALYELEILKRNQELISIINASEYGNESAKVSYLGKETDKYRGLAEIDLLLAVNSSTERSWNWRSLQNVSLTELAKCLYNWDSCLLNPRTDMPWNGTEAADCGYGPREGSFVYVWSLNQASNFSKFYDGARGEKTIGRKITVYRSCEPGEEWISKERIYLCANGTIYKCIYRLSSDEVGIVSERAFPEDILLSNFEGGYICKARTDEVEEGFYHDTSAPEIECDNCYEYKAKGILFRPEIKDPEPGTGISKIFICQDPACKSKFCKIEDKECLYEVDSCSFENRDFWIYAEDVVGNKQIAYGGKFELKKGLSCPCSFDRECLTGSCRGSPPVCSESTTPKIDII